MGRIGHLVSDPVPNS